MNGFLLLLGLVVAALIIAVVMRRTVRSKLSRKVKQVRLTPALKALLERLLDCSPESEMATLKSRRSVYNQAVSIYLTRVRGGFPKEEHYARVIRDLMRLRRALHPPALLRRYLTSTRDLVAGLNVRVCLSEDKILAGRLYFLDEDHLMVGIPNRAALKEIHAGLKVSLQIMVPGQGLYLFTCRIREVIDSVRSGLKLEHIDDSPHPNRRDYVRERIGFRFEVRNEKEGEPVLALANDISGGGMSFLARHTFAEGQDIWINLPAEVVSDGMSVKARVLRAVPRDAVGTFRYSLRWQDITVKKREAIIRYVQSEHLRRFRP